MAALVLGAALWLRYAGAFPFPLPLFLLATLGTALSSVPLITGWADAWGGRHFAWLLVALDSAHHRTAISAFLFLGLLWAFRSILINNATTFNATHGSLR